VPAVNVIWTPEGMQQFDSVDLSVAVSIPVAWSLQCCAASTR
jgi:hypothetical protein